jgi:hypothetical protein
MAEHLAVEVSCVGLKGTYLPFGSKQLDELPPQYLSLGSALKTLVPNPFYGLVQNGTLTQPTVQYGQLLLPFPEYTGASDRGGYVGQSSYQALQAKVEKRFGDGGTLLAAYTFSKIIADLETLTSWLDSRLGGTSGVQNWYNLKQEYSLSNYDSRQRLTHQLCGRPSHWQREEAAAQCLRSCR